jgi:hypothetical protein
MNEYLNKIKVLALQNIKNTLPGHTVLDESTYVDTHTKARFVDEKYGEWWAYPINVNRGHFHKERGSEKSSNSKLLSTLNKYHLPSNIILDISTFSGLNKRARFVDEKYGEWWTTARNVLERGTGHPSGRGNKIKATMQKRYGVNYNMQKEEFAKKAAKSMSKSTSVLHWKTAEELICVGSYENFIVDYLNQNRVEFKWQSDVFTMPNGKTYRPDLFLINENKWVEIKGYFRKDAREKWDWFHETFPNSELWDESKLTELGYKIRRNKCLK